MPTSSYSTRVKMPFARVGRIYWKSYSKDTDVILLDVDAVYALLAFASFHIRETRARSSSNISAAITSRQIHPRKLRLTVVPICLSSVLKTNSSMKSDDDDDEFVLYEARKHFRIRSIRLTWLRKPHYEIYDRASSFVFFIPLSLAIFFA